jgi:hypothetical protein
MADIVVACKSAKRLRLVATNDFPFHWRAYYHKNEMFPSTTEQDITRQLQASRAEWTTEDAYLHPSNGSAERE